MNTRYMKLKLYLDTHGLLDIMLEDERRDEEDETSDDLEEDDRHAGSSQVEVGSDEVERPGEQHTDGHDIQTMGDETIFDHMGVHVAV